MPRFRPSAHPRAGGENIQTAWEGIKTGGSSPRGRGKPRQGRCRSHGVGLIPARAGKTPGAEHRAAGAPAHPRAGGENVNTRMCLVSSSGSSPRGRGKRRLRGRRAQRHRLIPARAGKTWCSTGGLSGWWAHPRAGGENAGPGCVGVTGGGSSPRGRGKRHHGANRHCVCRLIPARAGKTTSVEN